MSCVLNRTSDKEAQFWHHAASLLLAGQLLCAGFTINECSDIASRIGIPVSSPLATIQGDRTM